MDYRNLKKAVQQEKIIQRNMERNFANKLFASDNMTNAVNRSGRIVPSDDSETLTEKQLYIADKLLESRNYKGYPLFDDDYHHLCRNLLSNRVVIDGIEIVAVQYSCGFRFSFIDNEVSTIN